MTNGWIKQQTENLKVMSCTFTFFNLYMKSFLQISLNLEDQPVLVFGIKYSHFKFCYETFLINSLDLYL